MPRTPVALETSDWHLAPGAWKRAPEIRGDSYHGLDQAVALANKFGVPMLALGDLFDSPFPDGQSLYHARKAIESLYDNNFYYVQGNHEYSGTPVIGALSDWASHIHRRRFRLGPLECYGLDYMPTQEMRAEFETNGRQADVLLTHQAWRDLIPWRLNGLRFEEIPYSTTLCGDFHRHDVIRYTGRNGPGVFHSPGPLSLQALDENPQKQVFLLYDDLSVDSLPLKCRPLHSLIVEDPDGLEAVVADAVRLCYHPTDLVEVIQRPIVRVRYADHLPEAAERLQAALGSAHLFLEAFKAEESVVVYAESAPSSPFGGIALQSCLASILDPQSAAYRDTMRLLDAADPAAEIEKIKSDYQVPEDVS